eukprot:CAMPEP_0118902050 /NCGR_PEP_ID=MMETSP1166-20130328/7507_1 /TAXON_ID=1104430 /ORGANISM="Chrysoreinhardia sp, Strain CCMP3193" /LENGTH=365 /DNA_ID=CAMNT_0006841245 /DNA_START=314 /DNA_END=1407 /DNA_ORIENTATION=-
MDDRNLPPPPAADDDDDFDEQGPSPQQQQPPPPPQGQPPRPQHEPEPPQQQEQAQEQVRGVKRSLEEAEEEQRAQRFAQQPPPRLGEPPVPIQPPVPVAPRPASSVPLRTGQWTQEEIAFAKKVIEYFDRGSLPNCTNGTTLRALLADVLHCSPMRISKKFAGDIAIGKRTFTKHTTIDRRQTEELERLELDFHESIQGRARWPLVEWKTLLLGRTGDASRSQQAPLLGAPGPRPGWMMAPPAVPDPPRGQREVRHTLSSLREHCAPITLGRLEAGQPPPEAAPAAEPDVPPTSHPPHFTTQRRQPQPRDEPTPPEPRENSVHQEVYGWVPSELGVPDTDPAVLAQILDAERESRPYQDDVARRG